MEKDYTQRLNRILNLYAPVSQAATELIFQNGSIETSKKSEVIFHEKRFNAFEYFQLEGISHRFNVDSDLQALTTGIYHNEVVITPHFARTPNGRSIFSLQALTDCTYLRVPAGTFLELSNQNDLIRMFGRAVVEKEYMQNLNFDVLFRSFNAKDRLLYFRTIILILKTLFLIPLLLLSWA